MKKKHFKIILLAIQLFIFISFENYHNCFEMIEKIESFHGHKMIQIKFFFDQKLNKARPIIFDCSLKTRDAVELKYRLWFI